jgi:hypothetical protein
MIEFVNIKTNEHVELTRPSQIAAYINSSDLSPNASKGQDFGWRLAPELVVKIDEMSQDPETLDRISRALGVGVDEISIIHIVQYLSSRDDLAQKTADIQRARNPEFKQAYDAKVEALRNGELQPVIEEAPVIVPPAKKK